MLLLVGVVIAAVLAHQQLIFGQTIGTSAAIDNLIVRLCLRETSNQTVVLAARDHVRF
jgi:hypothetical protein